MKLFSNELHTTAITAGKIILGLESIEKQIYRMNNILEYQEDILVLAYMCRVGIMDRVEINGWPPTLPIRIPLGIFKNRKETIVTMLIFIISRLKEVVSPQEDMEAMIDDILEKGDLFYEFDSIIPYNIKSSI